MPPLKVQPAGVPPELELEELELLDELELLEELELLLDELELLEELELLLDELELLLDEPGPPQPNMARTGAATMAEPKVFTKRRREASGVLRDKSRVWSSEICLFIVLSAFGGFSAFYAHRSRKSAIQLAICLFIANGYFFLITSLQKLLALQRLIKYLYLPVHQR